MVRRVGTRGRFDRLASPILVGCRVADGVRTGGPALFIGTVLYSGKENGIYSVQFLYIPGIFL